MPDLARAVILALLAAGCTPAKFVWHDDADPDVAAYRQAFSAAAGRTFTARSSREQLLQKLAGVRVLWLGDHHRSARLHALQGELLAGLQRTGRPLVLALEAVGHQDEPAVNDYLAGLLTLDALRERVRSRWPGSWLDDGSVDSAFYRSLLATARALGAPVCGLEPTPRLSLAPRDDAIVGSVRAAAAAHPHHLVVVVVGQAHLIGGGDVVARAGLPALALGGEPPPELREAAPADLAGATLYRSSGGLWWFAELLRP